MARLLIALLGLAAGVALAGAPAWAAIPARCTAATRDSAPRPLLPSLMARAVRLFGLGDMPAEQVQRSTVVRCMGGQLLACNVGANLPCGRANTSRSLSGGVAWCRQHPDADFIPAFIVGHDSIYRWRCTAGAAVATGPVEPVDGAGFITRYWKPIQ